VTSGERMVWAAEFAASMARALPGVNNAKGHRMEAAARATELVVDLRALRGDDLQPDVRAMLDDMLGNGADR